MTSGPDERKSFLLQAALPDFYAEYQLNVAVPDPAEHHLALSRLHQEIQDAFKQFGVQIMSPNFRSQPDSKVWTPKEHWYDSPAKPPGPSKDDGATS